MTAYTMGRKKTAPDPQGRIDILIRALIERAVEQSGNPMLQQVYGGIREPLHHAITRYTGPKNQAFRDVTEAVRMFLPQQQQKGTKCD